jgi:hypothetical protein
MVMQQEHKLSHQTIHATIWRVPGFRVSRVLEPEDSMVFRSKKALKDLPTHALLSELFRQ